MPSYVLNEQEIQQERDKYRSDHTGYMRWCTEVEQKKDMIDGAFMKRHMVELLFFDKFAPMANFTEPREKQLHKLKMIIADLLVSMEMYDDAEATALSAQDDIAISRGDKGFFSKLQVTERHEINEQRATETEKKVGFINKLFGKTPQQPGVQQQG